MQFAGKAHGRWPATSRYLWSEFSLCQKHGREMMQRFPRCAVVVPTPRIHSTKAKHDLVEVEPWAGSFVQGESTGCFLPCLSKAKWSALGKFERDSRSAWGLPVLRPRTSLSCRPSDSRNGRALAKERHRFARPIASSRFAVGGRPDRACIHQSRRSRSDDR